MPKLLWVPVLTVLHTCKNITGLIAPDYSMLLICMNRAIESMGLNSTALVTALVRPVV